MLRAHVHVGLHACDAWAPPNEHEDYIYAKYKLFQLIDHEINITILLGHGQRCVTLTLQLAIALTSVLRLGKDRRNLYWYRLIQLMFALVIVLMIMIHKLENRYLCACARALQICCHPHSDSMITRGRKDHLDLDAEVRMQTGSRQYMVWCLIDVTHWTSGWFRCRRLSCCWFLLPIVLFSFVLLEMYFQLAGIDSPGIRWISTCFCAEFIGFRSSVLTVSQFDSYTAVCFSTALSPRHGSYVLIGAPLLGVRTASDLSCLLKRFPDFQFIHYVTLSAVASSIHSDSFAWFLLCVSRLSESNVSNT